MCQTQCSAPWLLTNKSTVLESLSVNSHLLVCPEHAKFEVVRRAQAYFRERCTINDIDGARVIFPDGWGLVRASNTQPVLVLRFEAQTPERLAEIRAFVEEPLRRWVAELS